ncbi:OPT/YSL family transporter, partial [Mitsuokella jalaludinii]|uniref:OPT/YSL family transporter n=1 Tax=Mitsuokella jalaludinii TaxID=187979 RepID=UPI00307C39F0
LYILNIEDVSFLEMAIPIVLGGVLGVFLATVFRRYFCEEMDGVYPFPSGSAAAEVLESDEGSKAHIMLVSGAVALVYDFVLNSLGWWQELLTTTTFHWGQVLADKYKLVFSLDNDAALLGIGLAFFCFRFVADGDDWASYPYNRHLYNNSGVLKGGTIIDSRGVVLSTLSEDGERVYNEDGTIRRATLHAVGDPAGNIGAGALTAFADKLSGYNLLTGAYSPLGTGNSVYLTIDSELNRVAYEALGGQSGTVGVYNYKTGEILCMVSTPTFDPADPPNIAADDPAWDGVYVNRLLSANSIPGSIFKVVTLNAAIENIPDLFQRKWNCTGSVEIGGDVVTCPYAHGEQDIEAALANSCNGVFGQLAVELGAETMKKYTDAAGLTESLRVDGIQTASGHFDFDVSENQLAWAGVGQGQDTMCPISMLQYMGAIANGGKA